jgi:3-oxoadipate enol-lactonase
MLNVTDLGSGIPVVWVHGYPHASSIFENQIGIAGIRHIVPDLPGFGQSRPDGGALSVHDYARMLVHVLDERGIDRAVFAGLSMGGYICLAAAALAPERLRGLILIDTRETPDTAEAKKGRAKSMEQARKEGVDPIVEAMLPKMLTADAPQAIKDRAREIMRSASVDGVVAALQAMADRPDSTPLLPKIKVPTLIVVGEEDAITPPADAERMAAAIPGARLVRIAGAAHLPNFQKPEEFNKEVAKFVSGV